ncbi:MAG: hypothetical protein F6J86_41765 [Symploca sp. SIO1B1]|nr:hypothetical protein [Symploca sp. SIO1B1]
MVKEIRIYIEGGGDDRDTKRKIRQGFNGFLKNLVYIARNKRIKWDIIVCGFREDV